jgi:hypothetical protein
MSFADDLKRFELKTSQKSQRAFVGIATAVKGSVVDGSPVTAAPGQPVDTGYLKASWILGFPSATLAEITTNVAYAPYIESRIRADFDPKGVTGRYGVKGGQIGPALPGGSTKRRKSVVGGSHSVKLTVAGFERLVDRVVARMGTT